MPQLLRRKPEPPLPETIELAGGALPLTFRKNPRAKRMIMRIAPGGGSLIVTVPRGLSARKIRAFLERHRGWVEERISGAPDRVIIAPGAVIPLHGEPTLLVHRGGRLVTRLQTLPGTGGMLSPDAGNHRTSADDLFTAAGLSFDEVTPQPGGAATPDVEGVQRQLLVGGDEGHFSRRVVDFLKRLARRELEAAVRRHAETVGLHPKSISIKDTTSRWGSCTHDRRLAFSWRIVMAPPDVLDYLAAHEVAHFAEMNHGPKFWALCERLCPHTEAGKAWLKRHGSGLHAIRA